uniref:61k AcORF9 n=1 Tax=Oryctes rhinoceros nudivirus TaxID=92521 RepID=A0A6B9QQR7_9VIRU|nr:61k AcORF9 [Oryctes rhinoceros nudivirus]UBR58218.1 PP78/83 protein [Oryctes rhinoceros nudivirus]WDA64491.1 PP78/83 protein [Oryctes rhinoceros nudivirus]WDA64858.1 PP78/83 protein [Oryctes rhinoceros nudivirus]WDA64987.1 PP78/83 protein [Oryctes rhinoceros nudivirus]
MDLSVLLNNLNDVQSNSEYNYNFGVTINSGHLHFGDNISSSVNLSNADKSMDSRNCSVKKIIIEPILATQEDFLHLAQFPKRAKFDDDIINSEVPNFVVDLINNKTRPILIRDAYGALVGPTGSTKLYQTPIAIDDSMFRIDDQPLQTDQLPIPQTLPPTIPEVGSPTEIRPPTETIPPTMSGPQSNALPIGETSLPDITSSMPPPPPQPPPPPLMQTVSPKVPSPDASFKANDITPRQPPTSGIDALFDTIRSGNFKLRPVNRADKSPIPIVKRGNESVASILSRRIAIGVSDDELGDSGDENWTDV